MMKPSLIGCIGLMSLLSLKAAEKPNIIFLFSDDQTGRAAASFGNKDVITPHLDKLGEDGVRFKNHYNTTAICMASRCNVLTGLYEYRNGCNFTHGDLQQRFMEQSYPVKLRENGYYTGFAGKIGFEIEDEEFDFFESFFDQWAGGPAQTMYETAANKGIAKYADRYPHCSRAYAAWADDFLKDAKKSGKPFCMSISFKAPHLPFTPDPIDLKLYEGKTFTPPPNYGSYNANHLSQQSQTSRAATHYREWINDYQESARNYYALITGVDAAIGMIRKSLSEQGLSENTVIIYSSDNGYNSGSHGFGDKVLPYEEGSKSPLVIYDPRLPKENAGKDSFAITANVDIAATIFSLAETPAPDDIDGKSILPLLENSEGKIHDYIPLFNFWGVRSAQSLAIVTTRWKYIHWYYAGNGMPPTDELFDLEKDPFEMKNMATDPDYSKALEQMQKAYDTELQKIGERHMKGHKYEGYSLVFDRSLAWEEKTKAVSEIPEDPTQTKKKSGSKTAKKKH